MAEQKWCLECKKELGGEDSNLSWLGMTSGAGIYCKNSKCQRYGLVTAIYLKPDSEAPEDAVTNNDIEETK